MIEGLGVEVIGGLGTVINNIATGLTIQTAIGSDWQALSDIKAQKNFDRLSDMIDYDEVRKDLEPYIETVDGYIAKHHQNLNESLLSVGYREQFVETFYKTHPQCLGMKADCDVYLEK